MQERAAWQSVVDEWYLVMPVLAKLSLGSRVLIFRRRDRTTYFGTNEPWGSQRLLIPIVRRGPFLCFVLEWKRFEIEFGLKRWV